MKYPISRRAALLVSAVAYAQEKPGVNSHSFAMGSDPRSQAMSRALTGFWQKMDTPIIDWLQLPRTARALDVGCGKGDHTLLFAERSTAVTALDRDAEILAYARKKVAEAGRANRVRFVAADLGQMPLPPSSFDLVWASHVLHSQPDVGKCLAAFRRVTRPGGRIVIRENRINASLLPYDIGIGSPGLEARLDMLFVNSFTADRRLRGRYPFGWDHALREAGSTDVLVKSFLNELHPPFSDDERRYLTYTLTRKIGISGLSEEDNSTLRTITDPGSPNFFLLRDDVHYSGFSTIYVGRV